MKVSACFPPNKATGQGFPRTLAQENAPRAYVLYNNVYRQAKNSGLRPKFSLCERKNESFRSEILKFRRAHLVFHSLIRNSGLRPMLLSLGKTKKNRISLCFSLAYS